MKIEFGNTEHGFGIKINYREHLLFVNIEAFIALAIILAICWIAFF